MAIKLRPCRYNSNSWLFGSHKIMAVAGVILIRYIKMLKNTCCINGRVIFEGLCLLKFSRLVRFVIVKLFDQKLISNDDAYSLEIALSGNHRATASRF